MPILTFTPNIQVIFIFIILIIVLCYIYYELYILKSRVNYLTYELESIIIPDKKEESHVSIPEIIQNQFATQEKNSENKSKDNNIIQGISMDERIMNQSFKNDDQSNDDQSNDDQSNDDQSNIKKTQQEKLETFNDIINPIPHGLFTNIFQDMDKSEEEQHIDIIHPHSESNSESESESESGAESEDESDKEIEEVSSTEYKKNETEDYSGYTVKELKEILSSMNLPYSGNKQKLISRIIENKK